jgi:UDP-2,3-diacylglucosamine pyrophosphatase LpxH
MKEALASVTHGHVISDLHMFAKWSSVDAYMDDIRRAAADGDFFVFNGDIFDFRWSVLSSANETVVTAVRWFEELCSEYPQCHFFYVLGNHDCHAEFLVPLAALARRLPNFHWHDSHLKVGSLLFLHGDLVFSRGHGTPFKRVVLKAENPRPAIVGTGYHLAIGLGAHSLLKRVYAEEKCARRFLKAMEAEGPRALDGIKDVYMGHTHASFSGFKYNNLTFHNTGAAIHDLHCNMMRVSKE